MTEWQPIKTAPKDGRLLWLTRGDGEPQLGWWSSKVNAWAFQTKPSFDGQPTRWKPEAADPAKTESEPSQS
jgi:hypothetical protein